MNKIEILTIRIMLDWKNRSLKQIMLDLGATGKHVSEMTLRRAVKKLIDNKLFEKSNGSYLLSYKNPKIPLINKLSTRFDLAKLLLDSNEKVFRTLCEPRRLSELVRLTKLSEVTVFRSLEGMMETGAVQREDGLYKLVSDELLQLSRILYEEHLRDKLKPYSELIFDNGEFVLIRVPSGREETGTLTGFSVYGSYGITIHPAYDYYVQGVQKVGIEEVFVHSLVSAENKLERTHCALFYVANRDKIDLQKVRELVRRFNIERHWLELQNYIMGMTFSQDLFLPRKEFEERARLYDVDIGKLVPPKAYPEFFEKMGQMLPKKISAFLFGGENMRIRGLKHATKDVDLVIKERSSFNIIKESLRKMGYRELVKSEVLRSDRMLEPGEIFVKEGYPRVDIFTGVICAKFKLTPSMMERSERKVFGRLELGLMSREDLFLLKAITGREADDVDMLTLISGDSFNWKVLLQELYLQEKLRKQHFCFAVLESIEMIMNQVVIKIPIYRELVNHTIDVAIVRVLQLKGPLMIAEIARNIGDIKEYQVRRRIKLLSKKKVVSKLARKGNKLYRLGRNSGAFMRCELKSSECTNVGKNCI